MLFILGKLKVGSLPTSSCIFFVQDGVHQTESETPVHTDEQIKLMKTQDLKYINFKWGLERKVF